MRKIAPQLRRVLLQKIAGNIDGNIGLHRRRGAEQNARFSARTRAEFDQRAVRRKQRGDRRRIVPQQRKLAAGRIIFRQLGDALEQRGAGQIVKIFRRQLLRLRRKPGRDVGGEWIGLSDGRRRASAAWCACHVLRSVLVFGEPQAGELPAGRRIKEIAISQARMPGRRRQRRAAQYHLIDHELAVVFAERAGRRPLAGIRRIGAARPLPDHAECIAEHAACWPRFPTRLRSANPYRTSAQRHRPHNS